MAGIQTKPSMWDLRMVISAARIRMICLSRELVIAIKTLALFGCRSEKVFQGVTLLLLVVFECVLLGSITDVNQSKKSDVR